MMVSLKSLRKDKGLSQQELANALGVSPQAVSSWEIGSKKPSYNIFTKLSNVLDCSASTLIEVILGDDNQQNVTGNRLRKLRTDRGWTQEEVADRIGISRPAYVYYETGGNRPVRKLKELTALFGVTADYLMGIDEPAEPEQIELPTEPTPYTREDVIKAFTNLLDVASEYLAGRRGHD